MRGSQGRKNIISNNEISLVVRRMPFKLYRRTLNNDIQVYTKVHVCIAIKDSKLSFISQT